MRADQLLVERGLAASRSQAARLIAAGLRWREAQADAASAWRTVAKNRDELPLDAELELVDAAEARYVSRGGLKLEGALGIAGLEVGGLRCLDIGQSSGGFTDCLLQHGADHVVGVDVGHGQLHQRLRDDERVTVIEKVNARHLRAQDLIPVDPDALDLEQDADEAGEVEAADAVVEAMEPVETPNFALIVGDLSFISLTLVLPALVPFLAPQGNLLMLVKPQFELQPGQVGKGGIVRDPAMYARVEKRLRDACAALGLKVLRWFDSPVEGGDGNREFFVHAVHATQAVPKGAGGAPTSQL